MNITVYGYYDENNLGDEAYKIAFIKILERHLTFRSLAHSLHKDNSDLILVGGGDIINDYFQHKIQLLDKSIPKWLLSAGIPFPSLINEEYLEHYDKLFVRNIADIPAIQEVVGFDNISYTPDFAFALDRPPNCEVINRCGIFLVSNFLLYPQLVDNIVELVSAISKTHEVIFFLFNTSSSDENDFEISVKIASLAISQNYPIYVDRTRYTVNEMLNIFNSLDFAVCSRYHAHIFSIIINVPFLSISTTRKTQDLMKHANLLQFQYQVPLDCYGTPKETRNELLISFWNNLVQNKQKACSLIYEFYSLSRNQLNNVKTKLLGLLREFENKKTHKNKSFSKAEILIEVNKLIQQDSNVSLQMTQGVICKEVSPGLLAQIISLRTLNTIESNYNYGIIDKYINDKNSLGSSIDYMLKIANIHHSCDVKIGLPTGEIPIHLDPSDYKIFINVHRSGWWNVILDLSKRGSVKGFLFDAYVDRTFHWNKDINLYLGKIPYTSPWVGFLHHTAETKYSPNNLIELFRKKEFIESLFMCKGLFVLSEHLIFIVKNLLNLSGFDEIKVFHIDHPMPNSEFPFSLDKWKKSKHYIIQIGSWLRNPFAIYQIDIKPEFTLVALAGQDMSTSLPPKNLVIELNTHDTELNCKLNNLTNTLSMFVRPCTTPCRDNSQNKWLFGLSEWLLENNYIDSYKIEDNKLIVTTNKDIDLLKNLINNLIKKVEIITHVDDLEYDKLLSKSIVFLNLVDAAAVNTLLECVIRSTPIVINKLPATIEVLGENYPLFYNQLEEVDKLLTEENVENAHCYLKEMDKCRWHPDTFLRRFREIMEEIKCV